MADTVRYLMEEMVPELEALEERGYFSRAEIRAIVQRRQDFEYALKRMAALKQDYLRYIDYEGRLEELRCARRKSRGISGKKALAEFCIIRRIHFIYERAARKFRGDLGLWSRWLRFCQATGSRRQMSKVLTRALQLHSGCAALWTHAAAWEFEANQNAAAARALMQRGLRMCKHAPQLWHEYFRLELLYALRLRERRRVLGIAAGDGELAGEEEEGDDSAAAVAAVLNGAVAGVVYRSAIAAFPGSVPFRAKFLQLLAPLDFPGKAALEDAVYDSVARDFGDSPEAWDLRARRHVLALPPKPAAAARLAAARAAVGVYEQGLRAAPSPAMLALLLGFLQQQVAALDGSAGAARTGSKEVQDVAEAAGWLRLRTQEALEEASADGLLTEQLRLDSIAFFLHHGEAHAALTVARAGTEAAPRCAALWRQRLLLEAAVAADHLAEGSGAADARQQQQQQRDGSGAGNSSEEESEGEEETEVALHRGAAAAAAAAALRGTAAADLPQSSAAAAQRLEEVALQALRAVPSSDADGAALWLAAIGVLAGGGCSLPGLAQLVVDAAMRQARGPVQGGLGAVAAALLTALHGSGGIEAARPLYRALLPLPPAGGDFFRCLLQLESQLFSAAAAAAAAAGSSGGASSSGGGEGPGSGGAALSARQLGDLFEAAADAYGGEDVQLWLLYIDWQAGRGKPDEAAKVYWKGRKALAAPAELEAAYQLRFKVQAAA
ncbi:hypothetical protein ABPG75_007852 [Micractinium tetrahymenae]